MPDPSRLKLRNGSRVAVVGGGPAGSFFSYFLLEMAARTGLALDVDIYEPRDFDTAGPPGCNMCAGVLHESLVQSLAAEGINLPTTVVQRGMDMNILHMDSGSVCIRAPRDEKRIATTFRGIGPRGLADFKWGSLDGYLLSRAVQQGAHRIPARVDKVDWVDPPTGGDSSDRWLQIKTQAGAPETYDLVAVAAGVNTAVLKQFENLDFGYRQPRTLKTVVREYHLGAPAVARYMGSGMHAFLLNLPRIEYAALVPKGDYVTLCLIGHDVDDALVQEFMNQPAVKGCFPPDYPLERFACKCSPRINVGGCRQPYGDRIVFVGDSGVSRLFKDGNGAAYRAGKAAARTAIFEGIAAQDFKRHYMPLGRSMDNDNTFGNFIFHIVHQLQRVRAGRATVLRMVSDEQRDRRRAASGMSMVLWDMFTGSAPYREIFIRTLHPVFWTRFLQALAVSAVSRNGAAQTAMAGAGGPREGDAAIVARPWEDESMEPGALGKVYHDGETIVRQGEMGTCMYVVQEGQVEVVDDSNGHAVRLAVREAGDFFGEMAIFERDVRSATVRALGEARVLTVDDKTFLRRVHEDPSLAYRLVKTLSRRIRDLSTEIAHLKTNSGDANQLR
ncbi:MAG: cyclic nucleotide-binding domain-containing protein [Acidobacteriota bacterium]